MSFFPSASGFQMHDNAFINVGGNMNIHAAPIDQQGGQALPGLGSLPALGYGLSCERTLTGPERNGRQTARGASIMSPYDNSHRPLIARRLHSSSTHAEGHAWAMPTSNALVQAPFPEPEHDTFHQHNCRGTQRGYTSSRSLPAPVQPLDSRSNNNEFSPPESEPASQESAHATRSFVSLPPEYPFLQQPRFSMFSNPPTSQNPDFQGSYPGITPGYPSPNFEPRPSTHDRSEHPSSSDVRGPTGDSDVGIFNQRPLPWERPQDEPRTSIHGSTFIGGNVNYNERQGESGLQFLHRVAACDAFHNSGERYPPPNCHPETRTEMLQQLWNWTCGTSDEDRLQSDSHDEDSRRASRILWLYGPAGAGKSAIAQSLCQKLEGEGRLAASFFFKRGHASRGNANRLFSTIAYQLAVLLPGFNRVVSQNVENDPAIVVKSLSMQLKKLIIEPCQHANLAQPPIVIIDGLDECEGRDVQQEVLRCFANCIHEAPLPVCLLVASRPESHIREMFQEPSLSGSHRPVNVAQSFEDVRTYLLDNFAQIYAEHHETMAAIPRPWPSRLVIEHLIQKSSGHFIYASTVIKFIDNKDFRPPDRLKIIMGLTEPDSGSPFAALDQLYTQILSNVPARARLLPILTVIAARLHLLALHIDQLLDLDPGDVRLALRGLHSLIRVPEKDDWIMGEVSAHHASFLDYLDDPARSGLFYVGGSQHRTDLACLILKALSYNYDDPGLNCVDPVAA
ncbi:hypothetical protein C8F04DRAFT_1249906 [Mycena alexandri]|uniref:Nephrocystin 3-like N-terminal domain-containing protein n=1 Tax=Mycena alexandri TaxID=1745969 RepID=A0AAD6TER1_9AGAR|nr:hypothetical protein C8F04DRAFT_1249906 [Mycena alexandri]